MHSESELCALCRLPLDNRSAALAGDAASSNQHVISKEMIAVDFLLSAAQRTPEDSSKEQYDTAIKNY